MDRGFQQLVLRRWEEYFSGAEPPIGYYYTNDVAAEDREESTHEERCLIGNLNRVREGFPFVYDVKTPGCPGGKRYSGFTSTLRPDFEYFLSCGIPGKMEGERYKKSPELVREFLEANPAIEAPGGFLVFKRWDRFRESEEPLAVVFFAKADVLSGLFTLANYDLAETPGVVAPMGAGCASILNYPLVEARSEKPKCVLGMFDVSARPHVPPDTLTFTIPMRRFEEMVAFMGESFLTTKSWRAIRDRL